MTIDKLAFGAPYLQPIVVADILFFVMIAGPPTDAAVSRTLQHLLSNFEILVQLVIEFGDQAISKKDEDSARVQDQHGGKRSCIPKREPYTHATRIPPQSHEASS